MNTEVVREIRLCKICGLDGFGFSPTKPYFEIVMPETLTNSVVCRSCYNNVWGIPFIACNKFDGSCYNYSDQNENISFWKSIMEPDSEPYTPRPVLYDEIGMPCYPLLNMHEHHVWMNNPCAYFCMECIHNNIDKCQCSLCSNLLESMVSPK